MPHTVVLATGGTISSRSTSSGSFVATDTADQLVSAVRGKLSGTSIEPVDVLRKNSFNFTLGDMRTIVGAIDAQLRRPDVDAVVVTHGTDTLEETAFLADLVHEDDRPVVFTGSQVSPELVGSDAVGNLVDAVGVALSPVSREKGVLVSFAREIYAARGIRKAHTLAAMPFRSVGGAIGRVVGADVQYWARPVRSLPMAAPQERFDTQRVEMVMTYPGADPALFRAAVAAGARGIVLLGTGAGNLNERLVRDVEAAVADGVVVALGTRVAQGPVVPLYGNGGAADALSAGAVSIGDLPPSQARILLALLLEQVGCREARSRLRDYCSARLLTLSPVTEP